MSPVATAPSTERGMQEPVTQTAATTTEAPPATGSSAARRCLKPIMPIIGAWRSPRSDLTAAWIASQQTYTSLMYAHRTVESLAGLPLDWDSHGSPPVQPLAIRSAKELLLLAGTEGIAEPTVIPLSGGGIDLEWSSPARSLEIIIYPDGRFEYVLLNSSDDVIQEQETSAMQAHLAQLAIRSFLYGSHQVIGNARSDDGR
jgi:hypothetical protein